MRVAIYCRVSTEKQDTENQAVQLREYAARQGWEVVHEYTDYESGSKSDRTEFQRLFADAERGRFDLLLFWALDRLTREGVLPTLQYLERLDGYGVAWKSFTEQYFDSCGAFKDVVVAIMATLAKQERIKRTERTKAGLARVKAAGKVLGRPRVLHVSREDVARLRASGHSQRGAAALLGVSEASIRRLVA
jgi:DNA invertase Pin-like site-specific DNA recombinase